MYQEILLKLHPENGTINYFKVVPTNVEKHMMTHPAIKDVAVVGLPHEVDGELPLAFVVLSDPGQKVTVDELITYTNGKMIKNFSCS